MEVTHCPSGSPSGMPFDSYAVSRAPKFGPEFHDFITMQLCGVILCDIIRMTSLASTSRCHIIGCVSFRSEFWWSSHCSAMQIAADSGPDKYFEVFYNKNPYLNQSLFITIKQFTQHRGRGIELQGYHL
jgi:hypothetical protein